MAEPAHAIPTGGLRTQRIQAQVVRWGGRILLVAVIALALGWVGWKAANSPQLFLRVGLNGLTLAGLYFLVASGFTLIFGLMRVVNMAHGSLFLLAGYLAITFQEDFGNFGVPLLLAVLIVALIGVFIQQAFLRWNQGQELRQALITIAILIIMADQMRANYGGIAQEVVRPEVIDYQVNLGVFGLSYSFYRIFVLLCAVAVGVALWVWLKKTRIGMVVRAGVDDRPMVSALGINIQLIFALAFAVGSALAALAGVLWAAQSSIQPGTDTEFLLNSLIVVIIGGMGSLGGAAVGALLLGMIDSYADVYLLFGDQDWTNYSVLFTFLLLVAVLAVRPYGLFGRPA